MRFSYKQRLMGECLPRGYRVAYLDFARNCDVCYPIGIHLIVRWIHRLWERSVLYTPSELDKIVIEAESRGRTQITMEAHQKTDDPTVLCALPYIRSCLGVPGEHLCICTDKIRTLLTDGILGPYQAGSWPNEHLRVSRNALSVVDDDGTVVTEILFVDGTNPAVLCGFSFASAICFMKSVDDRWRQEVLARCRDVPVIFLYGTRV